MYCSERTALLRVYRSRVQTYSNAVTSLKKERHLLSQDDFMKRWDCAQIAREACTIAQRKLGHHVAMHGCLFRAGLEGKRRAA